MDLLIKFIIYLIIMGILYFISIFYNKKTKREMKTININITKQTLIIWFVFVAMVTGIVAFIISILYPSQIVGITCKDGSYENVTENKYIYCGEDIRPYTLKEYIDLKTKESVTGTKPLKFNITKK